MNKIQTLNKISSKGLDLLPYNNYDVSSEFSNPDAIILRSFKMHDMEFGSNLKAIARAGAGTNNIPVDKCSESGIVVFNTPGANANAVKEAVLTGLFLASRDVVGGINWVQSIKDKGDEVSKLVEQNKSKFGGVELKGKKLGVVGLGAIGAMVANNALNLGMEVIGYDPYISVEAAWELSSEVQKATGLETLLSKVDYLTIHIPLLENTKNLFNREKFAMMKYGVKILNFARGGLVNNNDLKDAMKNGKISTYITDFPEDDLLGIKGIIPIPHLGASTVESEDNCAIMATKQVKAFLETGNITNSVNFPNAVLPMIISKNRVTIAHKNIPNMIGKITAILADHKINICDMLNKSKGELAYTLIDLDKNMGLNTIEELENIDGVITVRVIS